MSLVDDAASARMVASLVQEGVDPASVLVLDRAEGSVPSRRARGSAALRTPLLLWIEDSVALKPGWLVAARRELDLDPRLGCVSGPLTPSSALSARDRALLVADFGPFLSPCVAGQRPALPGHALLFRREAIEPLLADGAPLREDRIFAALTAAGHTLRLLPELECRFVGAGAGQRAVRTLFAQARGWAGRRRVEEPGRSTLRAALWPAVAAVRTGRACVDAHRSDALAGAGARGALWLAVYSAAWALGESAGALLGPGEAEARWA